MSRNNNPWIPDIETFWSRLTPEGQEYCRKEAAYGPTPVKYWAVENRFRLKALGYIKVF